MRPVGIGTASRRRHVRWQGRRGSGNIEDRRAMGPRTLGVGGGALGLIVVVIYLCMGGDPAALATARPSPSETRHEPRDQRPACYLPGRGRTRRPVVA